MSQSAYLALDLGGSGVKAGVFDGEGRILGFSDKPCALVSDSAGHAEFSIDELYEAARDAVKAAVRASGAVVRAMAISSQGETFVSLDSADRPLHPAIIWYDSRATEHAARLCEALAGRGLLPQPIATAPKILWLRENNPALMSQARKFLLLPDYFAYRLTGEAVTDPTTAASTGLYADGDETYCPEALAATNISADSLSRIVPCATAIGRLLPRMAEEWSLPEDTLVVTGANDQYCGALGAGNCRPGIVSETTGTCLALVTLTDGLPDPAPPGLLCGRFPISDRYFALAYVKTAGLLLEWFSREFQPGRAFAELDAGAESIPIGSNGVIILPHFDGMVSPTPNPNTRGLIANLNLGHTADDLYRAILESLAFCLRENIELMKDTGLSVGTIRSIGGGAKSDLWLQMKADVTGIVVERPVVAEAATLGAAMMAAVGAGDYPSVEEAGINLYRVGRVFTPDSEKKALYEEPYRRYRELCGRMYGGL